MTFILAFLEFSTITIFVENNKIKLYISFYIIEKFKYFMFIYLFFN